MRVIALLVLQVIRLQLARCQGGGPSTFGYDASSACSKPYSRAGRARLLDIPCDFRRQNWCTIAGSSYPWRAVRRFVQENQGLMRRMYGDEKHINVLKAEFEKNDVELKYDDYFHKFTDSPRRFHYDDDYEFVDQDQANIRNNAKEYEGRGFTSRFFNDPLTKRLAKFPKLSEYTRSHFKSTEGTVSGDVNADTTSATTTTTTTTTTMTMTTLTTTTAPKTRPLSTTLPTSSSDTIDTSSTTGATTESFLSTTAPSLTTSTASIANETENDENTTLEVTVFPSVTVTQVVKEQNLSINEISSSQVEKIDEKLEEAVEVPRIPDVDAEDTTAIEPSNTTDAPVASSSLDDDIFDNAKETAIHETFTISEQQQFRPRPEQRPSSKPETSNMEGQLYQDVAAKDQQEQPLLKLRGINACPVKEEVVAPFWANNTRGEVLALLNLYPFEQYVHWEKCTHENKQMYCRDGCRCEQQYRLHRLLAYDPNNECRGIFSDWFKFPSCCVCRCYDLPLEFRVTSRSPRTQKQRIKVQTPQSRYL